ncbi:MAG: LamG domain-containing protein [Verrucomicrobiales bacterium]
MNVRFTILSLSLAAASAAPASLIFYAPMDNPYVGAGAGTDTTANGAYTVVNRAGTGNGSAQDFLNGGATASAHVTSGGTGQIGQALTFDLTSQGSNRALTFGDILDIGTGDYTVSLWYNTPTTSGLQFIGGKGNQGSGNAGWSFFIENGTLIARVGGGSAANRASQSTAAPAADTWNHLAMSIDNTAGTVTAYLNGTNTGWNNGGGGPSTNAFTAGTNIDVTNPLAFAIRTDGTQEFRGYLDEILIYDEALGAGQIESLYARGLAGITVPEPSRGLLAAIGIGAALLYRRRSRLI